MVTDATFRPYMRVVQNRLHRYREHPGWDDLLSVAYIAVYEALDKLTEEEQANATGLVVQAAYWAACNWFDSPANMHRSRSGRGNRLAYTTEPLEPYVAWDDAPCPWPLVQPDFAPALVERLWREGVADEARAVVTPEQWAAMEARFSGGSAMGCTANCSAVRAGRGIRRAREALYASEVGL
jgi:hypothetical protein